MEDTRDEAVEVLFEFFTRLNQEHAERAETLLAESVVAIDLTEGDGESAPVVYHGSESVLENVFGGERDRPLQLVPERVTDLEAAETILVAGSFLGIEDDGSPFETSFTHQYEIRHGQITEMAIGTPSESARREPTIARDHSHLPSDESVNGH